MVYAEPIKTNGRAYNVSPVVLSWYAWFPTDAYYIYSPNNMDGQMQNFFVQYYYLPIHSSKESFPYFNGLFFSSFTTNSR